MIDDGQQLITEALPTGFVDKLMTFSPSDAPTIFVYAQPGAGKSTLLHHMADKVNGKVKLIQVHEKVYQSDYEQYGDKISVVGMDAASNNAEEWDLAMKRACDMISSVYQEMKYRYTVAISKPILLLVDEWQEIADWAAHNGYEHATEQMQTLCTSRARKVGIAVVMASQTNRAKANGFEGRGDVLRGLTRIDLYRDSISEMFKVFVAISGGERIEYQPLMPHTVVVRQQQRRDNQAATATEQPLSDIVSLAQPMPIQPTQPKPIEPKLPDRYDEVIEMHLDGKTQTDIARKVFGTENEGSTHRKIAKCIKAYKGLESSTTTD